MSECKLTSDSATEIVMSALSEMGYSSDVQGGMGKELGFTTLTWDTLAANIEECCRQKGLQFHPLISPHRLLREYAVGIAYDPSSQRIKDCTVANVCEAMQALLREVLHEGK